jgi:site-specific recombinase XerC
LHELAKVVIGDIVKIERSGNIQYWIKVIGKGNKYREVRVPTALKEQQV